MCLGVPRCVRCSCVVAGSLSDTCDVTTGQCPCKNLTTSQTCGQCVPGTSGLDVANPFGCSRGLLYTLVIRRTVLHSSTVSGYSQDHTWEKTGNCYIFIVNIMAIYVGDEFETYESFKCNIEETLAYSVKLPHS